MTVPREMLEKHFVGGLLLGAFTPPDDFDEGADIADERLRWIVDATKIAHGATGVWPVDLVVVADVLERLGVLEQVGGITTLIDLIESWDEREDRAEKHAVLSLSYDLAVSRLAQQDEAETAVVSALRRLEAARERADVAVSLMTRAGRAC